MATVLDLPSEEDLGIVLNYKGQSIQTDVLELDDLLTQSAADARRNGDNDQYAAYFQKALKDRFNIELPQRTTQFLMISLDNKLDELKKKFSLLQDLYDTTTSRSQSTNEQSDSST